MPSAYRVPTISSHSRCWVDMGSPDPAVSAGLLHQLPSALPNLVSATAAALCFYAVVDTAACIACGSRQRSPLLISAHTVRAVLLASAIAATFVGRDP
jgi:hypothetical protein